MTHQIYIPFSGFYESIHSLVLDDTLETLFEDLEEHPDYAINHQQYSKDYCKVLEQWLESVYGLEIDLKFLKLISPREYNFSTDRILCEISDTDLNKLLFLSNGKLQDDLREFIEEAFCNRSGFISFYSNDLEDWPENPKEWDFNQLGALLEVLAYLEQYQSDDLELHVLDNMREPALSCIRY